MKPLTEADESVVRRYSDGDSDVVVADLGAAANASVDVVDGTAIVVVEDGAGSVERELDLPPDAATAHINNGVVTVEVER
ncbi:MAG: hypothetical protein ABEH77_01445 [Halobacteriaceae archaeon]